MHGGIASARLFSDDGFAIIDSFSKQAYVMTRRKVELPLRATIEYLAGRIDRSEYEYWVSSDWLELVRSSLQSGKTVTGISISQGANEEKDALVLSFGTRTAVQAPARPPLRKKAAKEARLPKHAAVTSG